MNVTTYQSILSASLVDINGNALTTTVLNQIMAQAVTDYSRYRGLLRTYGIGGLAINANSGASSITVVGGPYFAGQTIYLDAFTQFQETKVISSITQINPASEPILVGTPVVLNLSAPLTSVHYAGGLVAPLNPSNTLSNTGGLNILTGQQQYPMPLDFLSPEDNSWNIASGQRSYLKQYQTYYNSIYEFSSLISGVDCIAAETMIFDPINNTHSRVDDLSKAGLPINVLSITQDGILPMIASCPKALTAKRLFEVKTKCGKNIRVTENHKFLTPNGFRELSYLNVGDVLCHHDYTSHESNESVLPLFLNSKPVDLLSLDAVICSILSDLICHCFAYCRQYGEQSHLGLNICLDDFPLLNDVVEHILYYCGLDDLLKEPLGNQICQILHHLSIYNFYQVDDHFVEYCDQSYTCEQFQHSILFFDQYLELINLLDKVRLNILNQYNTLNATCIDYTEIIEINESNEEIYYDLHVPKTNNYLANGLWHHNCGQAQTFIGGGPYATFPGVPVQANGSLAAPSTLGGPAYVFTGSGQVILNIYPSPSSNYTMNFNYWALQQPETVPPSDMDALISYSMYLAIMNNAVPLSVYPDLKDIRQEVKSSAAAIASRNLAKQYLNKYDTSIRLRPIGISG